VPPLLIGSVSLKLALTDIDLLAWTRDLLLDGALALAEPKKLRYRLLHVAAKITRTARTATLRIAANWPWTEHLVQASACSANYPHPLQPGHHPQQGRTA
jgi:hypothetical protein